MAVFKVQRALAIASLALVLFARGVLDSPTFGQEAVPAGIASGTPSSPALSLPPPPLPCDMPLSINFAQALALASGRNPQFAFANQQINEAYSQLTGAKVLWLPSIRAGVSYNHHDGPLQANDGTVSPVSRSSLEAGLGTGAVGAGSPAVPGVTANFRLTDAVFQRRIAGDEVAARRCVATTVNHDLLLAVAIAYVDLLRAHAQLAIAQETLNNTRQLADLTANFARTGQGSQADADRAQTELALRTNVVTQNGAQIPIAAARLAELLSLPADASLVPEEQTLAPIDLVSHEASAADLVADGLSRRPELAESRELVDQAADRLKRERYAPLLPNMIVGVSQSGYGGGPGSTVPGFDGRFDLDAIAFWELRNFGCGELAAREGARSRVEQARLLQVQVKDRVAREIVESQLQSQSLYRQIAIAQSAIGVASDSYRRNLERIRGGQGLPLEVLQSIQALELSRREYLRTVSDYDEWQFRLYRALGCPIPASVSPTQ